MSDPTDNIARSAGSVAGLTSDELARVLVRVRDTCARLGDAADDPIVVENVIADEIALALDYRRGPPESETAPGEGAVSEDTRQTTLPPNPTADGSARD